MYANNIIIMSVIINPNSVLLLEVDSNLQQQNVKQPFYILQIDDIPCIDSWLLPSPLRPILSFNQKEFILQIHSTFVRTKVPRALFRWRKEIQLKSGHRGNAINARSLAQILRLCGATPVVTFRDGERINMKTELIGNLEKIMGTNNVVWPNLPSHRSRRRSWLKAWRVWKIVLVSPVKHGSRTV